MLKLTCLDNLVRLTIKKSNTKLPHSQANCSRQRVQEWDKKLNWIPPTSQSSNQSMESKQCFSLISVQRINEVLWPTQAHLTCSINPLDLANNRLKTRPQLLLTRLTCLPTMKRRSRTWTCKMNSRRALLHPLTQTAAQCLPLRTMMKTMRTLR